MLNHKCPRCNMGFPVPSKLKIHMYKHTGERPHKCPHCDYSTTTIENLNRHINSHKAQNIYKCPHNNCNKCYTRNDHLKVHIKARHS